MATYDFVTLFTLQDAVRNQPTWPSPQAKQLAVKMAKEFVQQEPDALGLDPSTLAKNSVVTANVSVWRWWLSLAVVQTYIDRRVKEVARVRVRQQLLNLNYTSSSKVVLQQILKTLSEEPAVQSSVTSLSPGQTRFVIPRWTPNLPLPLNQLAYTQLLSALTLDLPGLTIACPRCKRKLVPLGCEVCSPATGR